MIRLVRENLFFLIGLKGRKNKIRLYQFLKEPLIARFGQTWYDELCLTADEWFKQMK